jgi:hypothetical protein
VIEVRALDRIGVLYAIATALAELELDIVVARVQTIGHEVTDVFYLRDRTARRCRRPPRRARARPCWRRSTSSSPPCEAGATASGLIGFTWRGAAGGGATWPGRHRALT